VDLTGLGGVASFAENLVDRFFPPDATPEQRAKMAEAISSEVANRDAAKSSIMVEELKQQDKFTKRARPTVVYGGLGMIALNYVFFPMIGRVVGYFQDPTQLEQIMPLIQPLALPGEFWAAWGGVVGTWVLGRSAEKIKGVDHLSNIGKLTSLVTGNKK